MRIDVEIFPYKISQRTEFSKIVVYDMMSGKNITDKDNEEINEIIDSYYAQTSHPEDFYVITKNMLIGLTEGFLDENPKYLFIPDGVTDIASRALCDQKFELIHLPEGIRKIPEYCFGDCCYLRYLNVPASVKTICEHAFHNCARLEGINLPNINVLEHGLFYDCQSLEKITIPDTVEKMGTYMFNDCALTDIDIPRGIRVLPEGIFNYCANLEKVKLPDEISKIGAFAFRWCEKLTEIELPDTVEVIGEHAFTNCENLRSIKLSKDLKTIDNNAFSGCINLKEMVLPDNITQILGKAFYFTKNLNTINIPKNLKTISDAPFKKSGIETLVFNYDLPELITKISGYDYDLVSECKVSKLVIDSSVKVITADAFKFSGNKIKEIDYLGTKEEFLEFKKNNKKLFDAIGKVDVKYVENEIDKNSHTENLAR